MESRLYYSAGATYPAPNVAGGYLGSLAGGDGGREEALGPAHGCAGDELLRGRTGRILDSPVSGWRGCRQSRRGLVEPRGQSPRAAGEDGCDRSDEAAVDAPAPCWRREEGLAYCAHSERTGRRAAAATSGALGVETRSDACDESHYRLARYGRRLCQGGRDTRDASRSVAAVGRSADPGDAAGPRGA